VKDKLIVNFSQRDLDTLADNSHLATAQPIKVKGRSFQRDSTWN